MNIAIIGAGAVGGYFGAKMARAGLHVTFLVREKRYEALKDQGLRIRSVHGDFQIEPSVVRSPEDMNTPEVVVLAVKAYQLHGVFPVLDRLVKAGSKVLPLLNGLEALEQLEDRYGTENVLGGLNYVESTLDEHGGIVQTSAMQEIVFGPLCSENELFAQMLLRTLQPCDFKVSLSPSIRTAMWEKYIFLTVLSGMTSATRRPIGEILLDEMAAIMLLNMLDELISLASASGVGLPKDIRTNIMGRFESISKSMTSSMYRDLIRGLPLELESLQGYAGRQAEKHGVPVPCTRAVYSILHPYLGGIHL